MGAHWNNSSSNEVKRSRFNRHLHLTHGQIGSHVRLIIHRLRHARLSVARVLRTLVLLLNLSARGQPETSYLAALRLVAASITKFDEQIEKRMGWDCHTSGSQFYRKSPIGRRSDSGGVVLLRLFEWCLVHLGMRCTCCRLAAWSCGVTIARVHCHHNVTSKDEVTRL